MAVGSVQSKLIGHKHTCVFTIVEQLYSKRFFSETASFRMSFPNKFYNMEVTQSVYVVTLSCKCKFAARYDNTLLKIIIF